jgi:hypothetical protein
MPALNFREIARPDLATGDQDAFEMFARDFLALQGYEIRSGPDRGPDGGRDLVAVETRSGVGGQTQVQWLVSCKHKAHSGRSVTLGEETDIIDRVKSNVCVGFIGFYSTLPASSLARKLESLQRQETFEVQVIDREKIEQRLLASPAGLKLAERYFPASVREWTSENPRPARIFSDYQPLRCRHCGRRLLTDETGVKDLKTKNSGIVVFWRKPVDDVERETRHVYWCCKGACDHALRAGYRKEGLIDSWEDIPDLTIPIVYIRALITIINRLHGGYAYTDEALESLKELMLTLFPHISRQTTLAEKERIGDLSTIPAYLGGLGH